jgi:hypothetical protein
LCAAILDGTRPAPPLPTVKQQACQHRAVVVGATLNDESFLFSPRAGAATFGVRRHR